MWAKIRKFLLRLILWFFGLSIGSVILFRFVPIPVTPLMMIRCGEQLFAGEDLKMKKDWQSLDHISPHLQLAVVCSEDQKYLEHNGFDIEALKKAMMENKKGKRIRGGSTISQQTAKNVFCWPGRSYIRKGFEAYFTFLIELIWSKERIMEVYLNVIEMGDGIYGAEAAGQTYFKRSAENLKKGDAALIAACLPNPRRFNAGKPSAYIQGRKTWVLNQMNLWGGKLKYDKYDEKD